ncbi:hypothetical protein DFJ74DRAFT_752015 [Hyaloraphidium curvatum]|nr:hypothetical protein DFJ74DRAFT_752015 [Hyaloraphidium curvatum]
MKNAARSALVALLLLAALFAANAAASLIEHDGEAPAIDLEERAAIPFDQISIEARDAGGAAAPPDPIAGNRQTMTVIYDSFIAQTGPGFTYKDNRRFCQLSVKIKFPQGLTFTISELVARGFANLDSGVKGKSVATFYFSRQANLNINFPNGPIQKNYVMRVPWPVLVWCPCGANRNLQIKQAIQVTNYGHPDKSGLLTVDSHDLKVKTIFHLQWKWCR